MKLILLSTLLMMMLALFSCKSKQPLIINNHTSTTVRDSIVKDTISITVADSAFLQLYLSCKDNQVVIDKELKRIWGQLGLIYKFENGLLTINADYQATLLQEIDRLIRIIETTKETAVILPPIEQPKQDRIKWWERPLQVGLYLLIIGILISAIIYAAKNF